MHIESKNILGQSIFPHEFEHVYQATLLIIHIQMAIDSLLLNEYAGKIKGKEIDISFPY